MRTINKTQQNESEFSYLFIELFSLKKSFVNIECASMCIFCACFLIKIKRTRNGSRESRDPLVAKLGDPWIMYRRIISFNHETFLLITKHAK